MKKLKLESRFIWRTNVKVIARDLKGNIVDVQEFHNDIMNVGMNMFRDGLDGTVTDLEIKYLGIGGDNTAEDPSQDALISSFFQKAITSQASGATGVMISTTYVAPGEANTPKIEELGWFAGVDADHEVTDSGIMISRALYPYQKTSLVSLQIIRTDTISDVTP
ncbi:hypothetical protein ES705_46565 [subsurface metagenome]